MTEEVLAVVDAIFENDGVGRTRFDEAFVTHFASQVFEIIVGCLLDVTQSLRFEGREGDLLVTLVPSGQLGIGEAEDVAQLDESLPSFFQPAHRVCETFVRFEWSYDAA
jgi:hypothetical protein